MRKASRDLTKDPVVLCILDEIQRQGKTEAQVERAIGLTAGAFTRWKYAESKSYQRYIWKIADYLNVTEDYLLDTDNSNVNEATLSAEEIRLIKIYRKIDSKKRNCLLTTAELFLENNN